MVLELFVHVVSLTVSVGAGINMQPAYLSSAVHVVEPVFMYKGEEVYARYCTGKIVSFEPKGKGKACFHVASILLITAGRGTF